MKTLKLKAYDEGDLDILSTFTQDSLVPLDGMQYNTDDNTFMLLVYRYKWELGTHNKAPKERTHAGLLFSGVDHVAYKGFSQTDHGMLELLMLQYEDPYLYLIFSTDAVIRLHTHAIAAHLTDMGEPWPVELMPSHKIA